MGLKDKIIGSLENTFLGDNGWNQDNEDHLFQGETNLVGPSFTFVIFYRADFHLRIWHLHGLPKGIW